MRVCGSPSSGAVTVPEASGNRSGKNLNGLLDDPELMDIFKDFVEYIANPDRERRQAEMDIE